MHQALLFIYLIFFLILSTVCFTLPGIFLLDKSRIKFSFWEKIVLGTTIGLIFFTLLSYFLLILKFSFLILPLILIINLLMVKKIPQMFRQITFFSKLNLVLFLIVFLIGITGQMLIIAPSGLSVNGDLVFWSSHAHDGSWHIALMNEIRKGYPLQNPAFAGERLVNYHFFSDIAPTIFNQFFKFSSLDLYFRFFPLLYSILLGALAFLIGLKIGNNFLAGIWATIFTYFGGSFGYIVTYLKNGRIGGESLFWASQVQSSSGNPPQIAAFVIILTFLYLFYFIIKKNDLPLFIICFLLLGSLAVFKIYGAVVLLVSLLTLGIIKIIFERKIHILLLTVLSGILSAVLYLPNTTQTTSFLIFEPWWFIRTMVVAPDRLDWIDWEYKRQTYLFERNFKRVIFIEMVSFLIFLFGNLGTKALGILYFFINIRTIFKNYFLLLLMIICLVSLILPLLFLQKGVAGNTAQFLQYLLLTLGIISGVMVAKIINWFKVAYYYKLIVIFLLLILSLPTQIGLIYEFYNRPPFTKIAKEELLALDFLKQNSKKDSIVLTPPYNKDFSLQDKIPHIWDWSDTSYVPAFSQRRVFLADLEQVDIMGYDYQQRLDSQKLIFESSDKEKIKQQLKNDRIDYIYFPKILSPKMNLENLNLKKIFENDLIEIWSNNI